MVNFYYLPVSGLWRLGWSKEEEEEEKKTKLFVEHRAKRKWESSMQRKLKPWEEAEPHPLLSGERKYQRALPRC